MSTKKICLLGIMIALSMIFSYIDSLIPIIPLVPWIKIGLANICVLFTLYKLSIRDAWLVLLIRIVLVGFIFTSLSAMLYSLAGGISALSVMIITKKTKKFSVIGVSIAGAVVHNIGQLIIAIFVLQTYALINIIPVLLLSGALMGLLNGFLTKEVLFRLIKTEI